MGSLWARPCRRGFHRMERIKLWLAIPAVRAVVHQLVGALLAVLAGLPLVAAMLPPAVVLCLVPGAAPQVEQSVSRSSRLLPTLFPGLRLLGPSSEPPTPRVGRGSE